MTMAADHSVSACTVETKLAFLSLPATYGVGVRNVEVKETHMSWLFLAGGRVYKLKKPVKQAFLDFSTLPAREADCRAEVRLNRRLAPDVYLGIVKLTREPGSRLALNGKGKTEDWLVMMRRLPDEMMLDSAIRRGTVTPGQVEEVAGVLARFYRGLGPCGVTPMDYVGQFAQQHVNNRVILEDRALGFDDVTVKTVLEDIEHVLAREPEMLTARVNAGRIIEGHGDLRPEHVCLRAPPVIIDCLEFNRSLRLVDPFDELSDLAMECARLGAPWIGEALIERCNAELEDTPPQRLMAFYTAYRACVRARLALAHLLDTQVRDPDRWLPLARAYIDIAEGACFRFCPRGARPTIRFRDSAE